MLVWLSPTRLALQVGRIKRETYVIAPGRAAQGGRRVLLERGQGKVVLKFTTSEEMLPLSSSSQSRVSSCEVYTRMMHFICSLWTVEERSVCSPSSPDGAGRPTGTRGGRRPASSCRVSCRPTSLLQALKDSFLRFPPFLWVFVDVCDIQDFIYCVKSNFDFCFILFD